jgi:DNA helicase-2/ATP-dependent DNA helicase PcrA
MEKEFLAVYKDLNAAQKQAVDVIEGPVLVVAGPGTGKTQLLGLRVANILRQTDADAGNILCLTFTNKAAVNMRERLFRLIGPASRNVVVRTFHSFAAEVMNTYPDCFWDGARLSVAPDPVQLEIIQSILASMPLDSPLASTFAGAYTALGDVQESLKLAKEAGLTPEELRRTIRTNLAYLDIIEPQVTEALAAPLSAKKLPGLAAAIAALPPQETPAGTPLLPLDTVLQESLAVAMAEDEPTGKTKNTGKWKTRWSQAVNGERGMHTERKRNEWWLAVADVYEAYREQLHQRGYYDYSDMLIEVLEQLQAHPDMRADLQERYQYLLIDEFQDTNAAQLRLAHQVADHYAANGRPNLMAVGDDDQSIFAFNGEELNNMLSFQRSYPDTKLIVLTENYRSVQPVLDTAQAVIEQAEDRLINREPELTKRLTAQLADTAEIKHVSYPTRQHQQSAVAKAIKKRWDAGDHDIAVLARKHDSLAQLASILLAEGVPVRYERRSNVLEHDAVRVVCDIAAIAVAIAGGDKGVVDSGLARVLRQPMWGIGDQALWKLAVSQYSRPDWLGALLDHTNPALQAIGHWFAWLGRISSEQPLPLVMEYILGLREGEYMLSPFRDYYLSLRPVTGEYLECLSAIELLRSLTEEFVNGPTTLADFNRFVQLNLQTGRVIADESWFMSGNEAVELLTVYRAKGLEFNTVYVVDATENMWRPRAGGRASPANLQLQAYGEKYDDYVRLLYVALTRAKRNIVATSYLQDERGTELLPTPLLAPLPQTVIDTPAEDPQTVLEQDIRWPRLSSADERTLLHDRLENFSLSATALINFLNVAEAGPDSFMERYLLRLPIIRSPQGSYGTAIHAALETAQRLVNTAELKPEPVLDRFEATLRDEHLPPLDFERLKTRGESLLPLILDDGRVDLRKGGLAEQKFSGVMVGQACIGGNLDRLDVSEDGILISDYKTGKALSGFDTKDQTKLVKAWRHRTQLLFYALLVRHSGRFKAVQDITARMIYVEADNPKQYILELVPSEEELERLEQLIQAIWIRIQKLDFPDTGKYGADMAGILDFEADLLK